MNSKKATLSALCLACWFSMHSQATIIYFDVANYRSISDSPFASLNEFYLEDFEDGLLNTPHVSSDSGFVLTFGDIRSIDGDDGIIDGNSSSFGAFASQRPTAPLQIFDFTPDDLGRYPTFVGIVATKEPALVSMIDGFDAVSGLGQNLPAAQPFDVSDLVSSSTEFRNVQDAHFVGLYWSEGISRFGVYSALQVDHLQYSYATIPEPAPVALISLALAGAILRRRHARNPLCP
jgi:hypothetical protein